MSISIFIKGAFMMKRIIAIVALLALMLSMTTLGTISASAAASDWFDKSPAANVDYSFAVLGDIQTITLSDVNNGTKYVETLFKWILDNRESRKIEYVIGLGDTVDTLRSTQGGATSNPKEWQKVRSQLRKLLEADMPHLIVRGNHDDEKGYHQYVCTEDYVKQMDGFFYDSSKTAIHGNSMSNCYKKLEIGNHKYLMLGLDYNAHNDAATIAWANDLIASNPDYKVIISIHAYLGDTSLYYKGNIGSASADYLTQESIAFDGSELWNNLIKKHANVFMVLSGHVSATNPLVRPTTGDNGNKIYSVLVDPQTYEESDPSGFVYMINITNGGANLEVEYLSTSTGKYFGKNNQKTWELGEGFLPKFEPTVVTEATTVETTVEETTVAVTEEAKKGCKGMIVSTMTVCCTVGTALAAFAMRKKKD